MHMHMDDGFRGGSNRGDSDQGDGSRDAGCQGCGR